MDQEIIFCYCQLCGVEIRGRIKTLYSKQYNREIKLCDKCYKKSILDEVNYKLRKPPEN